MDWKPDTSGVSLTKPTPYLFTAHLPSFQCPADWVKGFLNSYGYAVVECVVEPYSNRWMFYSERGEFIIALSHEYMERLLGVLVWSEFAKEK